MWTFACAWGKIGIILSLILKTPQFQSCFSLEEKLLPLATETLDQNAGIFGGWSYNFLNYI
jgi:hypothetical protein